MNAHEELIAAAVTIGNIAGCNSQYTEGLARKIEKTGKSVFDLTVAELIALHGEHSSFYSRLYQEK